jgi:signal peptidase II
MGNRKQFSIKRILNKKWIKIALFCLSSLSLISWDRETKDMAREYLKDKAEYSYYHDSFRLQYVENTGAALSFADGLPNTVGLWLLGIIPLAFLLVLLIYTIRRSGKMTFGKLFSFSLIFAGGIGNVIDRLLFDRHVTDFMNIGIGNLRTGIFNFADVWITTGVIYLFIFGWKARNPKKPVSQILKT